MTELIILFINTILVCFSITTDDFFIALTYSLSNKELTSKESKKTSLIFACLQSISPFIGFFLIYFFEYLYKPLYRMVPYLVLIYLSGIGIKLLTEGIFHKVNSYHISYTFKTKDIVLHSLTTSLDALCLGIAFENYTITYIFILSPLIFIVTYLRSRSAFKIGEKKNGQIPYSAGIVSGIIIICIGIEIFITRFTI